ncbi:MAG TPA: DNA polymerase III subunit gamma/tau, partial [Alphaproteobacteria bacterium]|nr:DNA polymerase III subunit gamma/tau [Alphaproteobacteria bacterium]
RELIDGVRYLPTYGRYKVYIIDEVHMLSVNAFSALLKTLEEPPPRVTFIFATTEVRKIPVTVISRCQRFDLRRVDTEILTSHFTKIAGAEGSNFDTQALALIVRAADGSVRDGLSLLDQAISHANGDIVSIELVREMIGLADQARVFDLLEEVLKGEIGPALSQLNEQYQAGAEPLVVVQDLLTITHWLTRLKLDPDSIDLVGPPGVDVARGREMADKLGMADLTRVWQMLLKGHNEVGLATSPLEATEMLLVRLAFVADLPSPADLVRKLTEEGSSSHVPKEIPADSVSDSDNQTVAVLTNKSTIISTEPAPELETIALPSNFAAAVRMFAD